MQIMFQLLNEPAISGVSGSETVKLLWSEYKKQISRYSLCLIFHEWLCPKPTESQWKDCWYL